MVRKYLLLISSMLFLIIACQRDIDETAPTIQTGDVVFWAKQSCSSVDPITLLIDTVTISISSFSATEPSCSAPSINGKTFKPGTYTWKAYCSSDSITGVVTIAAGDCKTVELAFAPPPSTGSVTFWAKQSCSSNAGIVFTINGIKDSIISFAPNAPGCGGSGGKTFPLPVGNYTWKAACSSDTLAGEVTINKDQCTLVDVTIVPAAVDTAEYIMFSDRCDSLGINGTTKEVISVNNSGTFYFPPSTVYSADFNGSTTNISIDAIFKDYPQNWYGILFTGPAKPSDIHIATRLKLPGMIEGRSDTLKVNITKFGNIGEFIEGNLKGKILDDFYQKVFDVEMEFRIRRRK